MSDPITPAQDHKDTQIQGENKMSLTEKRLNEIQGRIDAATPGPWHHEPVQGRHSFTTVYYCFHNGDTVDRDLIAESTGRNATLITHAPTDLADLLAEIHRLRAELAKVRDVTEETVERSARAAYGPKAWDKLDLRDPMTAVQRSAFMAQIRTALEAVLGGGDDA